MAGLSKFQRGKNEDRQSFLIKVKREGTREDFVLAVVDELENFIKTLIRKYNRQLSVPFEDLMQDAYLEICEHIDEYDPEKTSPSAFFTNYINNKHREECRADIPQYYFGKESKLDKAAKAEGYSEGINDPNLTSMTLSLISKESLTTVKQTRKIFSQTKCSFEEVSNTEDICHETPDRYVEKEEEKENLAKAINSLSDYEKFVFLKMASDKEDGGLSPKMLTAYLSKHYTDFGLRTAPSQDAVKRTFAIAVRKLRGNKILTETFIEYKDEEETDDIEMFANMNDSIKLNLAKLD